MAEGNGYWSETEIKIMLRIAYHAITKNFILISDEQFDMTTVNLIKVLSQKHIQTVVVKRKNLLNFLGSTYDEPFPRGAIGIKETNLEIRDYFDNGTVLRNYIWTFFDGTNGTLRHQLDKMYIPYDSLLIFAEKIGKEKYYLNEYYSITNSPPGIFLEFGFWENNFLRLVGPPWYNRRSNMFGNEFVTIKLKEDSYLMTPKDKVIEKIWEELGYMLNFRIVYKTVNFLEINKPFDMKPGEEALLDSQIYLGDAQRYYFLLGPVSQSKLYMHIRVSSENIGIQRFIRPFGGDSWREVFKWIFYCSFFNFLVGFLFQRLTKLKLKQNDYLFSIFFPFYSLCVQSGGEGSNTYSARVALFSTRISASIMYYFYVAIFRSFLVLYIPNLPFTDLKGFIENGQYSIEGEIRSDLDIFFSISPNPIERLVYEKYMTDVSKWSRFDKDLERLCKEEKLVLLGFDDEIINQSPCEIIRMKSPISTVENGLKIRFNSPFKAILHVKLLHLKAAGILKRIHNRILYSNPKNFDDENTSGLKLEKVVSLFMIAVVGWIVGLLILTAELVIWKIKAKSLRRRIINWWKSSYFCYNWLKGKRKSRNRNRYRVYQK